MIHNFIPLTLFEEGELIHVRADTIVAVHDNLKLTPGLDVPNEQRTIVYTETSKLVVKEPHNEVLEMISDPLKLKKAVEAAQQTVMDFMNG